MIMKERKRKTLASKSSTEVEQEINEWNNSLVDNKENCSIWFIVIMVLATLPMFCYKTTQGPFLKILSEFTIRCEIPELESKDWNHEQIRNLSAPPGVVSDRCSTLNLDYKKISDMSYPDALEYVKNFQKKNDTVPCRNFVHSGNITYGVYQEMSLVCHKRIYEEILDISPQYGILFGQLFVLPLADLFGRKRVIRWGWNALIFSTIMTPSTTFIETIILGRFFAGVGFSAMFLPVQAIIVEISSIYRRPYRFVITYIGAGLSWIVTPLLVKNITHWRYLHWVLAAPLLLIPLTIWYLPESPLWFISRQMEDKGREILKALKDPVKQEELLLDHMNEKVFKSETFQNDYRKIKLFFKPGIWLLILLGAISGSVYFKGIFERFVFPLYISRQDYYVLSGGIEILTNVLCIILTLKCNRRHYVIAISLLVTCLGYFAAFALNENTLMHLIMVTMVDISSNITYIVISLLIITTSSTKYRCTCTGLLNAMGFTMGTIVINHFQHHLIKKTPALFLVLSIVSFIGSIVSYFSPFINEEDEVSENGDDNKGWDP